LESKRSPIFENTSKIVLYSL